MERGTQKINCRGSMDMSPAKGSLSRRPVFSLCSVMFTNLRGADLTWGGPEAARKGCAWANEAKLFFPCRCMSGWVLFPREESEHQHWSRPSRSNTSACPTENPPSLKAHSLTSYSWPWWFQMRPGRMQKFWSQRTDMCVSGCLYYPAT